MNLIIHLMFRLETSEIVPYKVHRQNFRFYARLMLHENNILRQVERLRAHGAPFTLMATLIVTTAEYGEHKRHMK